MNDLIMFLTSEEIMVVYAIAIFSAILCFLISIAQKTYAKRNQKQNTMELNRLVEEVSEKLEMEEDSAMDTPVVATEPQEEKENLVAMKEKKEEIIPVAIIPEVLEEKNAVPVMEEQMREKEEVLEHSPISEIVYESTEPDQTVAQKELEKLTEELQKAEDVVPNIELTEFEAEQEENAIISLDELLAKGNTLYEKNEVTQYQDEGDEPISLQDLEQRMKQLKEPMIEIEQEVVKDEKASVEIENTPQIVQTSLDLDASKQEESKPYQANHTFKSSPVISPIYGIENKQTDLELENTATLQKFDDEIRKTNEFVMTLKELQKNLE